MKIMIINSYVPSGKAKIYYEITGTGKPVLLLHAGVADRRMWLHQFQKFAVDRQVIAVDLQGYGKSVLTDENYNHFTDISAVIDFLGIETTDIIACSLGSKVALELALKRPERVGRMVLMSPGNGGPLFSCQNTLQKIADLFSLVKSEKRGAAVDILAELCGFGVNNDIAGTNLIVSDFVKRLITENYNTIMRGYLNGDVQRIPALPLHEIEKEALVVTGECDLPDTVISSQKTARELFRGYLVTVPGAAHFPNLEKVGVFNQVAREFLEKQ